MIFRSFSVLSVPLWLLYNQMTRQYRTFTYKDANYRIASPAFELITEELKRLRTELEVYIDTDPAFLRSLVPVGLKPHAPQIARVMAEAAAAAGVGPMAAVAGAFAEAAAQKALDTGAEEAIVENGGDIFLASGRPVVIGLYAGAGALSRRIAFCVRPSKMPLSLCSSSSTMGHSLSLGACDLAAVAARSGALADAAATFACNSVKDEADIRPVLEATLAIPGVAGVLVIKRGKIGMMGDLPEIVAHADSGLADKVTRDKTSRGIISLD